MTVDAGILVALVVIATLLAFGGFMVIIGVLIMLHYVVHTRRIREQDACFTKIRELQADISFQKDRVERMESLAVSTVIRLAEMAKIVAIATPDHGQQLKGMMDSLVKLFREQAPQVGIQIDANGDVTIGGDAVGHDKKARLEHASGLGNAS